MSGCKGPGVCALCVCVGLSQVGGLAVQERQGALMIRCLDESGAARAQAEIQSQYEQ